MPQNKTHMTMELMPEWLASTGFLFPTNELELGRFEKLYAEEAGETASFEVDCDRILGKTLTAKVIRFEPEARPENITPLKMVARKGSNLPKHIQDKIRKNQDERHGGANSGPEKGTE